VNRLAEKIRSARLKAKISEKDLAKKCGVSVSYLIQIESGKKVINEQVANSILAVLGEQMDFINPELQAAQESEKRQKPVQESKPVEKPSTFAPTDQWKSALSNIVKSVPIYDMSSWKVLGSKNHPVIDNKVEGMNGDKLLYVKVTDNDASGLRIKLNDLIFVLEQSEFGKGGIYLMEYQNKKIIRQIMKVNNKEYSLIKGGSGDSEIVDGKKLKLIGKCLSVSFDLKG